MLVLGHLIGADQQHSPKASASDDDVAVNADDGDRDTAWEMTERSIRSMVENGQIFLPVTLSSVASMFHA
ncbi:MULTISPECIES: hypothetical protein [Corynebacterium]|uniref:Uncharacterized protein n=2 Tax=Corynebacterium TaxID=1716 RepID=C0XTE4_CORLD|nr:MULTISPECIES: hypothetical protein [Corynebacterium]EEI16441.1 hypothetical protein HMPREF0298_1714 [Corynebacterium lipophiloflavum DSM 44291]MBA4504003.1 hypothetical protein [Corynebacterium sanguinis]MCT1464588.1 hypothetical protein [Corynebacterium sanguinis]MCT1500148.1 hypothetical protein [Corynebacterium sanguinis]MCT2288930.1 hypothetical protein [Corynebacterium sanguinis]